MSIFSGGECEIIILRVTFEMASVVAGGTFAAEGEESGSRKISSLQSPIMKMKTPSGAMKRSVPPDT